MRVAAFSDFIALIIFIFQLQIKLSHGIVNILIADDQSVIISMGIDTHQDLAYRQKLPAFMSGKAGVMQKGGESDFILQMLGKMKYNIKKGMYLWEILHIRTKILQRK